MKKEDLLRFYHLRTEEYTKKIGLGKRLMAWLSLFRLFVFAGGIFLIVVFFKVSIFAGTISMLSLIAIFGFILKYSADVSWKLRYHTNMLEVNRGELRSINEDYSGFGSGLKYTDPSHEFSHDIDMFGPASVFQSLNRCSTERERKSLRHGCSILLNSAPALISAAKLLGSCQIRQNGGISFLPWV